MSGKVTEALLGGLDPALRERVLKADWESVPAAFAEEFVGGAASALEEATGLTGVPGPVQLLAACPALASVEIRVGRPEPHGIALVRIHHYYRRDSGEQYDVKVDDDLSDGGARTPSEAWALALRMLGEREGPA